MVGLTDAWCDKHKLNHFDSHDCIRMAMNALENNGGGCMPKKTSIRITQDDDTIVWTAGNTKFTMTGYVDSVTVSHGFVPDDSKLTLVMRGAIKREVVHCEPHFDVTESGKHKFCDCTCLQCQSSMDKNCICKECDCGG